MSSEIVIDIDNNIDTKAKPKTNSEFQTLDPWRGILANQYSVDEKWKSCSRRIFCGAFCLRRRSFVNL